MTERFEKISVCGDDGVKDLFNDEVLFFGTSDEVTHTLKLLNELNNENEKLKQELYDLKVDYIIETYNDNSVRRDEKLKELGVFK